MATPNITRTREKRHSLVTLTCGAIWLVVLPMLIFAALRLLGLPGFWDRSWVHWEMSDWAIVSLALFVLSSAGLWRGRQLGVIIYGAAGILGAAIILYTGNTVGWIETAQWFLITLVHVGYSLLLWFLMGEPER